MNVALQPPCAGSRLHSAAFDALTEREREIAALLRQRLSNREIAEKLFLSEGSVKQYLNQIYCQARHRGRGPHEAPAACRNSQFLI